MNYSLNHKVIIWETCCQSVGLLSICNYLVIFQTIRVYCFLTSYCELGHRIITSSRKYYLAIATSFLVFHFVTELTINYNPNVNNAELRSYYLLATWTSCTCAQITKNFICRRIFNRKRMILLAERKNHFICLRLDLLISNPCYVCLSFYWKFLPRIFIHRCW